jgi:hypothetical protein
MTSLAAIQADFMAAIHGERAAGGLAVYRAQALAGWRAALAAAYPVVARLVGPAFFDEAADRYAARHPSTSGDLHEFGHAFPTFLEAYAPASGLPWLGDVARLEWALHQAAFAADAAPFDFASLAALAPDRQGDVVLQWHPATRRISSPHPILSIWEANQPARDGTPDRMTGPDQVIVWRAQDEVRVRRLDEVEWRCAEAMDRDTPLAVLVDVLGDEAARLPGILQRFAAEGAIAGYRAS